MKRALLVVLLAACANENGAPRTYASNDAQLAVGNAARMSCSCLFVMNMSEEFCHAWVKASPDVARFSFDAKAKTVEASALISFSESPFRSANKEHPRVRTHLPAARLSELS